VPNEPIPSHPPTIGAPIPVARPAGGPTAGGSPASAAHQPTAGCGPLLRLDLRHEGPVPVVRVRGDLDLASAHLLTELVDHVVAAQSPAALVLDLARLDFLSAAGITALLRAREILRCRDVHLVLRDPPAVICRVLVIGGVASVFDIQYDAEAVPGRSGRPAAVVAPG